MRKLSIILSVLFILALVLSGCGASKKVQEKTAEKVIEDAIGGDADVKIDGDKYTVKYGDGQKMEIGGTEWPTDKTASFIPKADFGKVTACTIMGNIYVIDIEDVKQKDYESYLQTVKDSGFTENSIVTEAEGYYQYQANEKKQNTMMLSYEAEVKKLTIMATAYLEE